MFSNLKPFIATATRINDITLPTGFERTKADNGSFATFLRSVPLKKSNTVYLYDGSLKRNQAVQYAVLDVSVGDKDLQQCADAVMRMRAEYLFKEARYDEIDFTDNAGKHYKFSPPYITENLQHYLQKVFAMCGTASLQKQLRPVNNIDKIKVGDVLIKGGSPGHAVLVVDVAENKYGKKIFLLAQSYMPAQDIHILKNPTNTVLSPWYEAINEQEIITPQWTFAKTALRSW